MSLGIFSFDLEALMNSMSWYFEITEPEESPVENEVSLENAEEILEKMMVSDSKSVDVLMETALNNTVTSVISAQTAKEAAPTSSTSKPAPPQVTVPKINEKARKELEDLLRSLQTSIIHNYRSSDIIDETVSLNNVANFPKREIPKDLDNNTEKIRDERKQQERKLELLRDDLKKAMLRNNSGV